MARPIRKRFDIYLINLDPTIGSEIKKTRPCVIISPDEMRFLNTCIIAPLTSKARQLICRVPVEFKTVSGEIALDQLRAVDNSRFIKRLGKLSNAESAKVIETLQEMFSP